MFLKSVLDFFFCILAELNSFSEKFLGSRWLLQYHSLSSLKDQNRYKRKRYRLSFLVVYVCLSSFFLEKKYIHILGTRTFLNVVQWPWSDKVSLVLSLNTVRIGAQICIKITWIQFYITLIRHCKKTIEELYFQVQMYSCEYTDRYSNTIVYRIRWLFSTGNIMYLLTDVISHF